MDELDRDLKSLTVFSEKSRLELFEADGFYAEVKFPGKMAMKIYFGGAPDLPGDVEDQVKVLQVGFFNLLELATQQIRAGEPPDLPAAP